MADGDGDDHPPSHPLWPIVWVARVGRGEFGSPVEASVGVSVGVVAECWGGQGDGGNVGGGGVPSVFPKNRPPFRKTHRFENHALTKNGPPFFV